MLAIDTNVLVRLLTGDHPDQSARAKALIAENDVLVTSTVLLETEWVLRSGFGFDRARVVSALTLFAGLPHVVMAEPDRVAAAIESLDQGMDFADALHLAGAAACEAFVTFDTKLIREASTRNLGFVREP